MIQIITIFLLLAIVLFLLMVLFVGGVGPDFFKELMGPVNDKLKSLNLIVITIAAPLIGGIGIYMAARRIDIADKQVALSREGKDNDLFKTASELIGSQNVETKVGGIFILEQLAIDKSNEFGQKCQKLLMSFAKNNCDNFSGHSISKCLSEKLLHHLNRM